MLARVDACIRSILRRPEAHAFIHDSYRRALVRKFPYAVIYEHAGDFVTVYGVFHTSSDPARWRRRLP